jgi:hypothetical protein
MKSAWKALLLIVLAGAALSADPVLTLSPADLTGAPGSVVGWGFTITNTTDFLNVTSSSFCLGTSGISTACTPPTTGNPAVGVAGYTDFIGPNGVIVGGANSTVTQGFDNNAATGVGSFTIDLAALVGSSDVGQIVITYDLYSVSPNDPNFDPGADLVSTGNFLSAPASVTVVTASPEPTTIGLAGIAFFALAGVARLRRR